MERIEENRQLRTRASLLPNREGLVKYCANCGSEYVEGVTECADCGGKEFLTAQQMHAEGRALPGEKDTRRFVRAGTADDPLSAETFSRALEAADIPVFARARRAGAVDTLTSGTTLPWWEILVPEESLARAEQIISEEARRIEAGASDAARAAEEEEAESEKK